MKDSTLTIVCPAVRKDAFRFKILAFCYFGGFIFFNAYYVLYLTEICGVSKTLVGTMISIGAVITIIAQGFWGYISDRLGNPRCVYVIQVACGAVCICMFSVVKEVYLLFGLLWLTAFFDAPIGVSFDSWCSQFVAKNPTYHYSGIRAWGSIAVAIFALGAQQMFDRVPGFALTWLFRCYLITAAVQIITALSMRFKPASQARPNLVKAIPVMFRNSDYTFLVISLGLVMLAFRVGNMFQANLIMDLGGTQGDTSFAWVVITGSEVPILFLGAWLHRRFRAEFLLLFSFCMFLVRIFIMAIATSAWMVLLSSAFNGLTYGICLPIVVRYINNIAPEGFKTSAMALTAALYTNASVIIGSALGGLISEHWGLRIAFTVSVGINMLGTSVFAGYQVHKLRRR